ncbi:MAG: ATP-binding protein [Bacteroidales bacterium]|nr:ATP-binding protein [Bacteroidales bacterium]
MKRIGLLVVIALSVILLKAQTSSISIDEGVSDYNVTGIIQDKFGYLWIGTMDGLNRFDGYDITTFKNNPDDPNSLFKNRVAALCEDELGNIWIGTRRGVSIYNSRKERFYNISIGAISCFARGQNGDMYIGTISGNVFKTNCYSIDYEKTAPSINFTWQKRVSYFVTSMLLVDDKLIVGTKESGVRIFGDRLSISSKVEGVDDLSQLGRVRELCMDSHARIWCITDNGTYHINKTDDNYLLRQVDDSQTGHLRQIIELESNCYAVLTEFSKITIVQYEGGKLSETKQLGTLTSSGNCMIQDRSQVLWVGTIDEGLSNYKLNGIAFRDIDFSSLDLQKEWITSIYEDSSGYLWFAIRNHYPVRGATLVRTDKNHHVLNVFSNHNSDIKISFISSIFEDSLGNMWFTSQGAVFKLAADNRANGIYKFDKIVTAPKGTQYSLSMCEDINGNLWLGTWNGVIYSQSNDNNVFPDDYIYFYEYSMEHNGISSSETTICYQDPKDSVVWVGTKGGGLNAIKLKDKGEKYEIDYHLKGHDIWSLVRKNDTLWVGTSNGLYVLHYHDKWETAHHYTTNTSGLPDNKITSVVLNDDQSVWVSTNKGIAQLVGEASDRHFVSYDKQDGLQANYFTTLIRTSNGNYYSGSVEGVNFFKPSELTPNVLEPAIVLTELEVQNQRINVNSTSNKDSLIKQSINLVEELKLDYTQGNIEIGFAAVHFDNPEKNRYAYRLKGAGDDWTYVDANNRKASFSNLQPGDYTFQVKAANADDVWMSKPRELKVSVSNPPWKTIWAYMLYLALISIVFYLFRRYSLIKASDKYEMQMHNMIIEKERELHEAKLRFFTNVSHELRTPLTLIYSPVIDLLESVKDNPKLSKRILPIQHNINRLMQLINQLLEFRKAETGNLVLKVSKEDIISHIRKIKASFDDIAESKNIRFTFDTTEQSYLTYFDFDKLEKIMYNLLANAFKYTNEDGEINVIVSLEDNKLTLIIKDNGIGIARKKIKKIFDTYYQVDETPGGTGIGLSLVKALVNLHKGQIEVESEINKGTSFSLEFPLGKQHYRNYLVSETQKVVRKGEMNDEHILPYDTISKEEEDSEENQLPSVLLVEDNPEIIVYLKDILGDDYNVIKANNGKDGLDKATELIPDLIISDILMPEMDGIEMSKALKSNIKTSHIPLLLLTAKTGADNEIEGLETGAYEYITKPFNPKVLIQKVKNILDTLQKQKEFNKKVALTEPERIEMPSMEEEFLKNVMEVIKKNLSDSSFEVTNLCAEIGLSRMQLHRKLKAITGQSTAEFIRAYKFKKAAALLTSNSMTVSEVMWEVGIESNSYFSRTFKSIYGLSPSEYKKKGE